MLPFVNIALEICEYGPAIVSSLYQCFEGKVIAVLPIAFGVLITLKEEQPESMLSVSVTLLISKLERSRVPFKLWHPLNIASILVTFLVSKLEIFIFVKLPFS